MVDSRSFVTIKQRTRRSDSAGASLELPELPHFDDKKPRRLPWYKVHWQKYTHTGNPALALWIAIMIGNLLYFANGLRNVVFITTTRFLEGEDFSTGDELLKLMMIQQDRHAITHSTRPKLMQLSFEGKVHFESEKSPDFGGLVIHNRTRFDDPIDIPLEYHKNAAKSRQKFLKEIDTKEDRYQPESSKEDENPKCRKVSWTKYMFPSCNQIHENSIERIIDDDEYTVSYLSSGTFRDAFRIQNNDNLSDHVVMKKMMMRSPVRDKEVGSIQKEALILERLTASSRVLNIYGHCGVSVLVEPMAADLHKIIVPGDGVASQEKLDGLDNIYPQNNLTVSEKLQIAIDMAESLADLHGFDGGPIIHADTHIEQWLIAPDKSIKLNDFNNAFEPKWDASKEAYCDKKGIYGSTYRSPEEFSNGPQDETVDTYAYGNNIYTLLTGLWPFYDEDYRGISHEKTREAIVAGKTPFVDPRYSSRSYIEGKLVEIMKRCWAYDRTKRPSIFEVVSFLRDMKREAGKRGELMIGSSSDFLKVRLLDN